MSNMLLYLKHNNKSIEFNIFLQNNKVTRSYVVTL